ncbi:hypothetical protein PINS_up001714 [Pythium insidiosum]|nr:hypothetical protein PINS_up001714 [Pythium insidiosum]
MELKCVCVLLSRGRAALLSSVQRHTGLTKVLTITGDIATAHDDAPTSPDTTPPKWLHSEALRDGGVGLLTSGSVGAPKVVACSWENMRLQGQCTHEQLFPGQPARVICATSISHAYSINAVFALYTSPSDAGSELCFVPDTTALHSLISSPAGKRTLLYGTPATYTRLLEFPQGRLYADVPYCAGTRLARELFEQTQQHNGLTLMQNYGSTETGDIAAWHLHGLRFRDEADNMSSAEEIYVGRLWPGVRVQVESSGEVLVWTPWQSMGYVVDQELRLRNGAPHYTADRGRAVQESDGITSIWLRGRIRPDIRVAVDGDTRVLAPEHVERVVLAHPDVTDALALMRPTSESLVIRIVLRDVAVTSRDELTGWVAEQLEVPHASVHLEVVEYLPCSPAGKLMYT